MNGAYETFFAEAARGIIILFTAYTPSTDWWMNVELHYEYGINEVISVTEARVQPFRPNIYETKSEKAYLGVDIIRFSVQIIIMAVILIRKVKITF